jgi:WD40 repeat protein
MNSARVTDDQNFFKFRRMNFDHKAHLSHFQLRNLMACATRDHIFYAGRHKVLQFNPWNSTNLSEAGPATVAMDLTDPVVQPQHGLGGSIQISTLTVGHDILIAGGFCGEYGLLNLKAHKDTKHTEGIVTENMNSITNHIQVHLSRSSSLPLASFASNDNGMRILDINTNKFIAEHNYDHAINCSAISPDQRLRVIVGDTQSVMICNADTGEILQSLEGHRDFGFACDWADDGWTVATGNQDMQLKIWDARKWTNSQGLACPVATLAANMAGVRKLKFSPLGSGKRVLLAAEPGDIISIFDGETFASKQTLDFFGEIGGVDFTNNGQDIFVANCDPMRGGLMEFERCGHASSSLYELEERQTRSRRRQRAGYDWLPTDEKVVSHPRARGTEEQRRRKPAALGITMGHF